MSLCGCKSHGEPWSLGERKFTQKEGSSGPAPGWASAGIFERICLLSKVGYFRGGLRGGSQETTHQLFQVCPFRAVASSDRLAPLAILGGLGFASLLCFWPGAETLWRPGCPFRGEKPSRGSELNEQPGATGGKPTLGPVSPTLGVRSPTSFTRC